MTSRRRFAAGFAALVALTGTLVFGGAIVANADDGLEATETSADTFTTTWASGGVVFSGTADPSNQSPIETFNETDAAPLCADQVFAAEWACNVLLPPGVYDVIVSQEADLDAGTPARQDSIQLVIQQPNPVATGPATVPAGGTISLTGTGAYPSAGFTAAVTTPDDVPGLNCGGSVVTDGSWGCDIPFDSELAPDSDATITITFTAGTSPARVITHDVHIEAVLAFTAPAAGDVDWTGTPVTISGIAVDTETPVSVFRSISGSPDPVAGCQNLSPTSGDWTCTATFEPGDWDLYATQGIESTSLSGYRVLIPAPAISQSDPRYRPITSSAYFSGTTRYQGTSESYVQVYFANPGVLCSSPITWNPATETGTWWCTIDMTDDDTFTDGESYTYTVRQEDLGAVPFRTATHTLVVAAGPPPALDCAFVPAGVTISSPGVVDKSVYRLTPWSEGGYSGGGSSSGGSDGGDDGGYTLGPQGYCNGGAGYQDPSVTTWNDDLVQDCDQGDCALSGLTPGIYEVYFTGDLDPGSGVSFDYLFRIPETPASTGVVSTANSVVMRGNGTTGDGIRIVRSNGATLCTTEVTSTGTWACQFPKSSAASARALAIDPQSGGLSAYSASRAIPVFVPEVVPAATPEPPLILANWFLEFGGDLMDLKPGDTFTLNVSGMPEGTEIEVWMHSTPRLIGTATGTGAPMALELTVPEDIESGPHEIEMIGVTPLGTQYFFTSDAMVTGGTPPAEPLKDEPVLEDRGISGTGGDRADPGAPSGISEGLAPLSAIVANPATIAIAGGLALALLFLVALPTELLNSSLSSNTSRLGRVYGAIDGGMTKAQDWLITVTRSRATAAGILVVLIAIIYGFVDPGFGFDIVSLRLVLALAIALFVLTFVASWISGMIIRRAWGAMGVVAMQPSILLFAVVGVVVARILDFSPGFLIGVAIGLELLQASKTVTAKAVFVQLAVVTGLALAAWVVYSFFTPGDDFFGMLLEDTMVAVTAEGLTGALIAVFPLKFLDGRELWEVSKRLWVAAFLIVSTAFALLVLPTAIEGTDVGDYGVWLLVFAAFGLISLAVWIVFVRADAKAAAAEQQKVDA